MPNATATSPTGSRTALDFMTAAGVTGETVWTARTVDFYTSARGAAAGIRRGAGRLDSTSGKWLAGSGHMIWIGDRTRQPDGAHVEFAAGVLNPIGLKCGPSSTEDDLKVLMSKLNPENEAGRLTDRAVRRGQGGRSPAAPDPHGAGRGRERGVVLRPDAWQRHQVGHRLQDAAFDAILREVQEFFRHPPRRRHGPGRRAFRDDRQGRDRMHRRHAGGDG
jgi:3-deoxy-7-phosphoheptulonate synthase